MVERFLAHNQIHWFWTTIITKKRIKSFVLVSLSITDFYTIFHFSLLFPPFFNSRMECFFVRVEAIIFYSRINYPIFFSIILTLNMLYLSIIYNKKKRSIHFTLWYFFCFLMRTTRYVLTIFFNHNFCRDNICMKKTKL